MGSPSIELGGNQAASLNQWVPLFILVVADQTAMTADTDETALDLGGPGVAALTLDVTARSGSSPTLDVTIQTRESSSGSWRTAGTFTQATAVGSERKCFMLDRYVRASCDVGGTSPSFTFTIKGEK